MPQDTAKWSALAGQGWFFFCAGHVILHLEVVATTSTDSASLELCDPWDISENLRRATRQNLSALFYYEVATGLAGRVGHVRDALGFETARLAMGAGNNGAVSE